MNWSQSPVRHRQAIRKIGRVVTSYGHWRMIDRWLSDDRLKQPHVSWVFVNDKPSDPLPSSMRERIEEFGALIEPKVNMGRCCARNLGVQRLDTEWVDVIDGDDIPLPVSEDFDADFQHCGFVYFDAVHHREIDGRIEPEADEGWTPPPLNKLICQLVGNVDPRPIAVMWRRAAFLELGGFDGRADYVEDLNLVIRARLAGISYGQSHVLKGSYQRGTPGRETPPIVAVANLWNWELARPLAAGEAIEALEEQIRFWRKAVMWAGMRETEKSCPNVLEKIRESVKWLAGRHRSPGK